MLDLLALRLLTIQYTTTKYYLLTSSTLSLRRFLQLYTFPAAPPEISAPVSSALSDEAAAGVSLWLLVAVAVGGVLTTASAGAWWWYMRR